MSPSRRCRLLLLVIVLFCLAGSAAELAAQRGRRIPSVIIDAPDTVHWLNVVPLRVRVTFSPAPAGKHRVEVLNGRLEKIEGGRRGYQIIADKIWPGATTIVAQMRRGSEVVRDSFHLIVSKPTTEDPWSTHCLGTEVDRWQGLHAYYGSVYNPAPIWHTPGIPAEHYQTIVTIRGVVVLNQAGVTPTKELPPEVAAKLIITEDLRPEDIHTSVYWRPGGTTDSTRWVLLLCNQKGGAPVLPLSVVKMRIAYNDPELLVDSYDHSVYLSPTKRTWQSLPFIAVQKIGALSLRPAIMLSCERCEQDGLALTLDSLEDGRMVLTLSAKDSANLLERRGEIDGKNYDVELLMKGKGYPRAEMISLKVFIRDEETGLE